MKAKQYLSSLWDLLAMRELKSPVDEATKSEKNEKHKMGSKFAKHLRDLEKQRMFQEKTFVFSNDCLVKLTAFDDNYIGCRQLDEHTLDFWKRSEVKKKFPEVYGLSILVNAVPVTQVSVERAFSIVAFILSNRRCQLAEKTLNDILLIRLNKQLFENIICNE